MGAQFNFITGLIPQKVMQGKDGRRANFSKLEGIRIRLQFQDISNETLRKAVRDLEFLWWLGRELA